MIKQYKYEFDAYGTDPANLIHDEPHTITPANGKNFAFFIPKKAPFHRRSVEIHDAITGVRLNPGTDYYFGWRCDEVILGGAVQPVYGAIVMNDPGKYRQVKITYQTVGGPLVLDDQEIAQLLANTLRDPRRALWSDITDIPSELPPVPHRQSTGDLIGFDAQVEVLYKIADAIAEGNVKAMQALMEHVKDKHNPHKITLEDLGIDELGNLVPATKEQAESGTENAHYMTSLRTAQYCDAKVIPVIQAHIDTRGNPHGTTKADVGLGLVENYRVASIEEAEAGVADNRYMTPQLTKIMLSAIVEPMLNLHVMNKQNPHGVTKLQVGLGKVSDYADATNAEAGEGIVTNKFMTPALTAIAIGAQAPKVMEFHTKDTDNPHNVTKKHVGLEFVENYKAATVQEAIAGTAGRYITADVLKKVIDVGGGGSGGQALDAHLQDHDNPHQVTKEQIKLGNVSNYEDAKAKDVIRFDLTTPTYMTTESMALWLKDDGGWENFINRERLKIDKVQNYGIATDYDIRADSNTAYATPATVTKMMENSVITTPMLTSMNIDPSTYEGKPYSFIEAGDVYMVDPRWRGLMVSYDIGEELEDYAYFFTDYELTGNITYKAKVSNLVAGFQSAMAILTVEDEEGTYHRLGLYVEPNGSGPGTVYLADLADGEVKKLSGTEVPVDASLNNVTIDVSIDKDAKTYNVLVKTEDDKQFVFNGTAQSIYDALGLKGDVTAIKVNGAYGFAVQIDKTAAATSGMTFSSDWLPNTEDGILYNVDNRKRWSYTGRAWKEGENLNPGDTPTNVSYRPGTTYWNTMTDELFVAVTHRHAIPYGMSSIVEE